MHILTKKEALRNEAASFFVALITCYECEHLAEDKVW
jgi:hypothetical protein